MCSRILQKSGALSTISSHPTTARHLEATRDAENVVMVRLLFLTLAQITDL
jgi:hypothetical protein